LVRRKAPALPVTCAERDAVRVEFAQMERRTELVIEQMKLRLETAGASLDDVMKCNVFGTSAKPFPAVNAVYAPKDPTARIYVCIPEWIGPFDIEIDYIAMI
jgi:2-iminobutanoate/2-iminopropanoate deaminase